MSRSTDNPNLFSLALIVTIFTASQTIAEPLYNIKDLTPDGYTGSVAYDINSDGDATGVASRFVSGSLEEAFFHYDHSTGVSTVFGVGTLLPRSAISGTGFREAAINDSDQIAGTARFIGGANEPRGFIYTGGAITNLGVMPGATPTGIRPRSDALDINNSGVATGTASSGSSLTADNIDAYTGSSSPVTDFDGDITPLTKNDFGRAINDLGTVAGRNELNKATLFNGPAETILTAGTSIAADTSEAMDLNELGQAVVQNLTTQRAYRYDPTASDLLMIPSLGPDVGGFRTFGKAINESGDVVGWGDRNSGLSGQGRGFLYSDADEATYILEDHVILQGSDTVGLADWGNLGTAWGVNDSGLIVGQGDRRFDGATFPTQRAYLLIPFDGLAGDYNEDGIVNAADYTVWRDNLGAEAGSLPNDAVGGVIGQEHYDSWRENFGSSASSSATSVPEPTSGMMAFAAALLSLAARGKRG